MVHQGRKGVSDAPHAMLGRPFFNELIVKPSH